MEAMEPFAPTQPVATLDAEERGAFVMRVYSHLLLAIGAFVAFETVLFSMGIAEAMYDFLTGASSAWLLILGAFMVIQWMATSAAHNLENEGLQYAGLFGMAAGQALIFAPFLYLVFNDPSNGSTTVAAAAAITAFGFAGLTMVAFVTRKDLSFLRPMLMWGGIAALVLIVAAVLFGLSLGIWFSVAMIALAGGAILYQTQAIMAQYPSHAHVGAAVQLFASVMMLFWYVLRLLSQLRR
jgi:FtsH-binding integral membrane protein